MAHRRAASPVMLTHYQALDMYLSEVRSIRESRVFQPHHQQCLREPQQLSQGDSARGTDHESSEEEENELFLHAAGFGSVVNDVQRQIDSGVNSDDSGELDSHMEGLPRSHARLLKARVHTLRSTLRHKKSQEGEMGPVRGDVRDIFNDKDGHGTTNHIAGDRNLTNHVAASYKYLTPTMADDRTSTSSPSQSPSKYRPTPPPKPKTFPVHPFPSPSSVATPTPSSSSPTPRARAATPEAVTVSQEVPNSSLSHSASSSELLDLSCVRHRSGSEGASMAANMRSFQSSPILVRRTKPGQLHGGGERKSPKNSAYSPDQEDIKLHFGVGSPVKCLSNGITDNLPRFTICPEPLGIAQTIDISPNEQIKVCSLALLELQITFDDLGIPLRLRRPIKHKHLKEKGVFGVPLTCLLDQDRQRDPNTRLPLIITEMLCYLERKGLDEEGLLRKCGSANRIKAMVDEIEITFHCGAFSLDSYMSSDGERKISDVASLLKQFFRQLPVPLLTRQYMSAFASIADITDLKEQVRTLNLLILILPDLHQKVLKRLMEFCQNVMDHSSQNKMTLTNVAMVIAPNLFTHLPTRQNLDDVTMAAKTSHVVRLLINYHELLWTVPAELLRQVRNLNECEVKRVNQRNLQKVMRLMQGREPVLKKSTSYTVPIYGPLYLCVRKMIHFKAHTTAAVVLQKFEHSTQLNKDLIRKRFCSSSSATVDGFDASAVAGPMFLHEVGGNIVERCLPPDTNMYLLYEANPMTEFVIKPRHCPDILPDRK